MVMFLALFSNHLTVNQLKFSCASDVVVNFSLLLLNLCLYLHS